MVVPDAFGHREDLCKDWSAFPIAPNFERLLVTYVLWADVVDVFAYRFEVSIDSSQGGQDMSRRLVG